MSSAGTEQRHLIMVNSSTTGKIPDVVTIAPKNFSWLKKMDKNLFRRNHFGCSHALLGFAPAFGSSPVR